MLFFLGEYANMILMSAMTTILFLGGWLPPVDVAPFNWIPGPVWFAFKVAALLFVFIWVRGTFPRYRYDQLMRLGWKVFLPLSLAAVAVVAAFVLLRPGGPDLGYTVAALAGNHTQSTASRERRYSAEMPLHTAAMMMPATMGPIALANCERRI